MFSFAGKKAKSSAGLGALAGAVLMIVGCSGPSAGNPPAGRDSVADIASAQAIVDQYSQPPTEFPVDVPLVENAAGLKVSMLQCVTPVCGLAASVFAEAGAAMGADVSAVKVSAAVADQQAGMDTIIASNPDGVIILGIEASSIGSQIEQLTSGGVAVTTVGLADVNRYGVQTALNSDEAQSTWGKVLGAYAVVEYGADADVVIYNVPELGFPALVTAAAEEKIAELCPDCNVREVEIPITSVGVDAPSRIVSDLQANPNTNIALFPFYDAATGLPAALSTADISVHTIGLAPSPSTMQDIKNGDLDAGIAVDVGAMFWMALDAVARTAFDAQLSDAQVNGIPPFQILTAQDITFDPAQGYHAFQDYRERFTQLWAAD